MAYPYIDNSTWSAAILILIILIAAFSGVVLGGAIANAPLIGAIVGWLVGSAIVGKLIFAYAKANANSPPPSATQPEE